MGTFLRRLFESDFMPHGFCWQWEPWVVWSNVLADSVIFLCYLVIGVTLFKLAAERRDAVANLVLLLFGAFIVSCGCTHAMEVYNTWHGLFRLAGMVKVVTAGISLLAVAPLLRILPKLAAAPALKEVLAMDAALNSEQQEKQRVEGQLRETQAALRNQVDTLEDQVKAQVQELRESEARLQGFIRHSPAAISFRGLDGRYLLINPKAETLFGRPSPEILGRTNEELFPEEYCVRAREQDQRVLTFAQDLKLEQRWVREDGAAFDLLVDKFPLVDATGQCWGLGVLATDITERKQAELAMLQSQKLESLGVLTGGIAHDFNNLLGAAMGNVELALLETSLAGVRQYLLTLEGLLAKAAGLVRQMLAYAGQGKASVRTLNLNRLVEEMIHLLAASISKKVSIHLELHPELPSLRADPSQMQQVIMNLVINAAESYGEQTGVVTVATRLEELNAHIIDTAYEGQALQPGPHLVLAVSDHGSGMAPEVLKRIFDPFFSTKFTGRGLGLAALHGIVRGHQGGIRVFSEPGLGSTFKLLFPCG